MRQRTSEVACVLFCFLGYDIPGDALMAWFSKPLATICYLLPLDVSVLSQHIPSTIKGLKLKFSTLSFSYTLLF